MSNSTIIEKKIESLQSLLNEHPNDLETILTYAEYQMRFGSRLEALQAYQQALAIDNDIFEAHLGLSVIYMHHGLYEEGFTELLKVLQSDYKNADARIYYDYFASTHEPGKEIIDGYNKVNSYDYTIKDLRTLQAYFDSLKELSELAISGLDDKIRDNDGEMIYEYQKEVALKRNEDIEVFKNNLVQIETNLLSSIDEIKKKKRDELEKIALEEENKRLEEEALIAEEELRRIEEERRREEEERLRLEEEIRQAEEELRRAEEERRRIEEEARRAEEERLRKEEEERRAEEERIRLEEEARRAEEERIRREEEERRAEEERIRLEEEARRAEEERLRREEEERKAEEIRQKMAKYDNLRPALCEAMQAIGKHRGVNSVILIERGGLEIATISPEHDYSIYPKFTSEVLELIDSHYTGGSPAPLLYAVLEYKGGLIALRVVASNYLLAVIAGSSSNFGVLRYSMEKVSEKLCEMLD